MADSIKMENYKKNVKRLADEWKKEVQSSIKELDSTIDEIKKLEPKKRVKQVGRGPLPGQAKEPFQCGSRKAGGALAMRILFLRPTSWRSDSR